VTELASYDKELVVRPLRWDDYDRIAGIQTRCFPQMRPWSREQFASHLKYFPEGQIGIEYDGVLVASGSTLQVGLGMYDSPHKRAALTHKGLVRHPTPHGTNRNRKEVLVDPEYPRM
jgi:hypothetical protein